MSLTDLIAKVEGKKIAAKKTFEGYEPDFIHIDVKYLPQTLDDTLRCYLFDAIDRAIRWIFMRIYGNMSEASSIDFLRRLKLASHIKISKIQSDNARNLLTASPKKTRKPAASTLLTLLAQPYLSSIV